jgi:hypothetical protein
MSKIAVAWDNADKTICKYAFEPGWNWQDYQEAIKEAEALLNEVTHPVNIIMDFQRAGMLPNGAINQVQKALSYPRNTNVNLTAIVGANAFIRKVAEVGQKLTRKQNWEIVFVSTLDEAHSHFEKQAAVGKSNDRA